MLRGTAGFAGGLEDSERLDELDFLADDALALLSNDVVFVLIAERGAELFLDSHIDMPVFVASTFCWCCLENDRTIRTLPRSLF